MQPYINRRRLRKGCSYVDLRSFLSIHNGAPYQNGEKILLSEKNIIIGRASKDSIPDISFDSLYISRRHAAIIYNDNQYYLSDLESTHGTALNGQLLEPNKHYPLNDGDTISLVDGLVLLTFQVEEDFDKTIAHFNREPLVKDDHLYIDVNKKQVWYQGNLLKISGKARQLLLLLYENKNRALSYDEIKMALWPERKLEDDAIPNVGNEEIYALVYRLRKSLGEELEQSIITVPGYGLILDENNGDKGQKNVPK